jgi:microcystin-dependent protein
MFAGNFAPVDWAFCDGSLLAISDYTALFNLIGTTYGGDGQNTFALPDLRGRMPVHTGGPLNYVQGQSGGVENVTLTVNQIPAHTHVVSAQSGGGSQVSLSGAVWAQDSGANLFAASANSPLSSAAIDVAGSSQPHDNLMPYLAINFIIALFGIYPSQN